MRQFSSDKPTTLTKVPTARTKSTSSIQNNEPTVETKRLNRIPTKPVKSRYKLTATTNNSQRTNQVKQLTPPKQTRPPVNKVTRKISTPYSNVSMVPSLTDFSYISNVNHGSLLGESVLHTSSGEQIETLSLEDKLDIQKGYLLLVSHLNIMAQKAYHDKEKEELMQLTKLHAYKRNLQRENFNLRREFESLEMTSLANFTLDELSVIKDLFDKLEPAVASLMELQQALKICQSQIKLDGVTLHPRDREQFQKHLIELQDMLAQSAIEFTEQASSIMHTNTTLHETYTDLSNRLTEIQQLATQVDSYAAYVLERVSLESHISLLEADINKLHV